MLLVFIVRILRRNALTDVDSANLNFTVAQKAAALGLSTLVQFSVNVELWREVLDSINGTVMRTRSTFGRVKVPFNAHPDGIARLRIVQQFTNVADRANMLLVLEARVLIQLVLLRVLDLDTDALTEQFFELFSCLLRGTNVFMWFGRLHFV